MYPLPPSLEAGAARPPACPRGKEEEKEEEKRKESKESNANALPSGRRRVYLGGGGLATTQCLKSM
jgi:hypothetical protein